MKKNYRKVVLDTNILISALLFTGISSEIIDHLENGGFSILITKEILEEYIRVLAYPKFALLEEEIKRIVNESILPYSKTTRSIRLPKPVCDDPDDDKFLSCAKSANADVIVSGDEALLSLKTFEGIPIISLSTFMQTLDA